MARLLQEPRICFFKLVPLDIMGRLVNTIAFLEVIHYCIVLILFVSNGAWIGTRAVSVMRARKSGSGSPYVVCDHGQPEPEKRHLALSSPVHSASPLRVGGSGGHCAEIRVKIGHRQIRTVGFALS